MTEASATYKLPRPFSVNAMKTGRSKYLSKEYKAWRKEAATLLMVQRARPMHPPYRLSLHVPRSWPGDLDNSQKAVADALQHMSILDNDRNIESWRVDWTDSIDFTVTVESLAVGIEIPHGGTVAA